MHCTGGPAPGGVYSGGEGGACLWSQRGLLWGVPGPGGGCLPLVLGEVPASGRGVYTMEQTPHVNRITDTCKNVTLPQLAGGCKYWSHLPTKLQGGNVFTGICLFTGWGKVSLVPGPFWGAWYRGWVGYHVASVMGEGG